MKKIYGYAALFAAMSLASCSSDNEPNVTPNVGEKQIGYLAINLKTPAGTRADGDYVVGSTAESKVEKACVICFNASDALVDVADFIPSFQATGAEGANQNTEASQSKEIKVENATGTEITQMITVLNLNENDLNLADDETVETVRKKLANFGHKEGENFVMTTAVYNDNGAVYTTPVTTYTDAADAAKNAVDVFVERVDARIDYAAKDWTADNPNISIDGANATELAINVTGITLANVASNSYLVKDISAVPTTGWTAGYQWNVPSDFRSHWATVAPLTGDNALTFVDGKSWNDLNTADFDIAKVSDKEYVLENTSAKTTCVLITAYIGDGKTDIYQAVANENYYTYDNLLTAYAGYLQRDGYLKADGENHYVSLTETDLELVKSDQYSGFIQIKGLDKVYKYQNDPTAIEATGKSLAEVNAELKDITVESAGANTLYKYRVYKWNQGACYYFAEVKPSYVGLAGVVRNHIYDMTLSGVKGMGVPVFDPTEVIVPTTPDPIDPNKPQDIYINANINILSWTIYTQGVVFE